MYRYIHVYIYSYVQFVLANTASDVEQVAGVYIYMNKYVLIYILSIYACMYVYRWISIDTYLYMYRYIHVYICLYIAFVLADAASDVEQVAGVYIYE
jgi:Mn2+/Fe2+ NRAMP family transporter